LSVLGWQIWSFAGALSHRDDGSTGPEANSETMLKAAISPFVDKPMLLLRTCGCVSEGVSDVEIAWRDVRQTRSFTEIMRIAEKTSMLPAAVSLAKRPSRERAKEKDLTLVMSRILQPQKISDRFKAVGPAILLDGSVEVMPGVTNRCQSGCVLPFVFG
jgi:hypothetical protein